MDLAEGHEGCGGRYLWVIARWCESFGRIAFPGDSIARGSVDFMTAELP